MHNIGIQIKWKKLTIDIYEDFKLKKNTFGLHGFILNNISALLRLNLFY